MLRNTIALALLVVFCSCQGPTDTSEPLFEITVIDVSQLPSQFDSTRTYEYDFSTVHPESILTVVWKSGIKISQAWFPLDYFCKDLRGPRLTVELVKGDDRMTGFHFIKGTNRLLCSKTLRRYVILN